MSMYVETYPNEGPLWPCGCLMGDPACHCPIEDVDDQDACSAEDLP